MYVTSTDVCRGQSHRPRAAHPQWSCPAVVAWRVFGQFETSAVLCRGV